MKKKTRAQKIAEGLPMVKSAYQVKLEKRRKAKRRRKETEK
jgi:hypothetical protein